MQESPDSFIHENQVDPITFSNSEVYENVKIPFDQNSENNRSPPIIELNQENKMTKNDFNVVESKLIDDPTFQDWTDILSEYSNDENKLVIRESSVEMDKKPQNISFDKSDFDTASITPRCSWGEQEFTIDQLVDDGLYDKSTGLVFSQNKKTSMTMLEAIEKGWICKDSIELYDPRNSNIIKLTAASEKGIIDSDNGSIVDSSREMVISFKDSVNKALETKNKNREKSGDNIKIKIKCISICEAIKQKLYNPNLKLFEFSDNTKLTLRDALNKKYLNSSCTMVRDPSTGQKVPFDLLVSLGLIDLDKAVIKDSEGNHISLEVAYAEKNMFTSDVLQGPFSLMKLFEDGYYHPELNMFFDLTSKKYIPLGEAIDKNILDSKSVLCLNFNTSEVLGLNDAFKSGLIDRDSGLTKGGFKLIDAYEQNDILIKPIAIAKAIELNLLNETTGKFLDPSFRRFFTLEQSIKEGLINPESTLINPSSRKPIMVSQAIQDGIIDGKSGIVTNSSTGENLTLKEVYNASKSLKITQSKSNEVDNQKSADSQIIQMTSHDTSQETAKPNCSPELKLIYKPTSNSFVDPLNGDVLTLEESIDRGYINPRKCLLLIPGINELIMLQKLIDNNMIDSKSGTIYNTQHKISYSFKDVLHEKNLIKVVYDEYSLAEAIDLDLFNPETGSLNDPNTKENISLKEALKNKLISPSKSVLILETNCFNISEAIESGYMDEKTADVLIDNERIPYIDALQNGLVLDAYMPLKLGFTEALQANLFDKKSKSFIHPISRQNINLVEALESEFLDSDKCFLYLPDSKKQISLSEAADQSLLSKDFKTITEPKSGKEFNVILQLLQAVENEKKNKSSNGVEVVRDVKEKVVGDVKEDVKEYVKEDASEKDQGVQLQSFNVQEPALINVSQYSKCFL